ncbi:hypothetical protein MKZ38_006582 [Zalerion maritima]|uniref:O-methyltransferase C-terminal domain-containing protein n=1 Tax=Zalerion maritima TaxID=339359 RepID=A0AAD5WPQ2_9PEZI|nr:hypothetical protein MKZ38_006582 [Zalerion maritima]
MTSISQIRRLARQILDDTEVLTGHLEAQGIDAPSFNPDSVDVYSIPKDEPASKARKDLVASTKELRDLAMGPKENLQMLGWESFNILSLHFVTFYNIASFVPFEGEISYEDLCAKVNSHNNNNNNNNNKNSCPAPSPSSNSPSPSSPPPVRLSILRRNLRHAILNNIFRETRPGFVAHTRPSLLLATDTLMYSWSLYWTHYMWPVATNWAAALQRWPGSEDEKHTALAAWAGKEANLYDVLGRDAEMQRAFQAAVEATGTSEGYDIAFTVDGYPWDKLGEGTVVDLGGSQGQASVAIASSFPSLKFVVQDLPGARLPSTAGKIPSRLSSRVSLTAHDFFSPQPVSADAYLLRFVLHSFPDGAGVDVLRALIPSLENGARIIINDGVLPEAGARRDAAAEKATRSMDVAMWLVMNAGERDLGDWKNLLRMADERFVFSGAWRPEGATAWFIEAVWTTA